MSVFTISKAQRRTVHTCSPRVSTRVSITAAPLPAEYWLEEEMLIQSKKGFCRTWWLMPLSLLRKRIVGGRTDSEILAVEVILLIPCCIQCMFNIFKRNLFTY